MATDPLSLAFIGCFLIGLLFLLITSFTGPNATQHMGGAGHMHALHPGGHVGTTGGAAHHGPSAMQAQQGTSAGGSWLLGYLNPMSLALFLIGFGFLGYIFHNAMASLALQFTFAIAGVGGIILALVFLVLLSRIFGDSEGATVQDVSDRTGLLGKVNMAIPQNSIGEITYISPGGMRKSIPARSLDGQRLERDQEVVVVNYQNGIAEVDTWDHFINQEGTGITEGSQADQLVAKQALLDKSGKTDEAYNIREESQKE
ncbi:MAG TPA: hypothetical protein VGL94_15315 [Ktedonobacteraceae bacterium]|jgi:hypothetical protein